MQECDKDVVVVATANDVSQLPPELIRRFNETFFVDLPLEDEREEILKIHLNKRSRDPETFDIPAIVKVTVDYTGAEIEKIVKESIAAAYTQGDAVVTTDHIVHAASELKPISKQMADRISELRTWADGKARFASSGAL